MSWYRRFDPRTFADEKFLALSRPGPSAQGIFIYLIIGDITTNLPGLIRIGREGLRERMGWGDPRWRRAFDAAFDELVASGLILFDPEAQVIRRPKCFSYDRPGNPKIMTSWAQLFDLIPDCELKRQYLMDLQTVADEMGKGFPAAFYKSFPIPYRQSLGIPLPTQDQEQEQEQEQSSSSSEEVLGGGGTRGQDDDDGISSSQDQDEDQNGKIAPDLVARLKEWGVSAALGDRLRERGQVWLRRATERTRERPKPKTGKPDNPAGFLKWLLENQPNLGPSKAEKRRHSEAQRCREEEAILLKNEQDEAALARQREDDARADAWWESASGERQALIRARIEAEFAAVGIPLRPGDKLPAIPRRAAIIEHLGQMVEGEDGK